MDGISVGAGLYSVGLYSTRWVLPNMFWGKHKFCSFFFQSRHCAAQYSYCREVVEVAGWHAGFLTLEMRCLRPALTPSCQEQIL